MFSDYNYISDSNFNFKKKDPFEFIDANQEPIEDPPSKQWIHILPLNGEIIISEN